ncbi:hypothetical protein CDAR_371951 [Caerostris darwini]|uniref:Uncharacterized protein n=1 Tax=Caerostris darwini TaxID=1538125 RepID=A0AAV4VXC6_9ARAC|nr:hypothetical protein CDAR_371951 [Caerostris darwini]
MTRVNFSAVVDFTSQWNYTRCVITGGYGGISDSQKLPLPYCQRRIPLAAGTVAVMGGGVEEELRHPHESRSQLEIGQMFILL